MTNLLVLISIFGSFLVFATAGMAAPQSIFANPENAAFHAMFYTSQDKTSAASDTAFQSEKKISELDFQSVPEWQSFDQVLEAFHLIRDSRLFDDPEVENFLRRITWLYPPDGCFTRAGLAARYLDHKSYPDVAQIFIMGSLFLKTKNIVWNYHVAPMVRVGNDVYVLDIAIDPSQPMKFRDWLSQFVHRPEETYRAAICAEAAWDPGGPCNNTDFTRAMSGHDLDGWNNKYWLPRERRTLRENAEAYLGDHPPWLAQIIP